MKKECARFSSIRYVLSAIIAGIILYCCLLIFWKRDERLYLKEPNKGNDIEIICDNIRDVGAISDGFVIPTNRCFSYVVDMPKLKVSFEKSGYDDIRVFASANKSKLMASVDELKNFDSKNIIDSIHMRPVSRIKDIEINVSDKNSYLENLSNGDKKFLKTDGVRENFSFIDNAFANAKITVPSSLGREIPNSYMTEDDTSNVEFCKIKNIEDSAHEYDIE